MDATENLIDDIAAFIRQYVVLDESKVLVAALWVVHTYCFPVWEQSPYLAVTSPEKQCGKSRLLDVFECVAARPWKAITPSEAVVYRKIHKGSPTLLLDETDAIFNPKTADRYEALRAMLNAGNRKGTTVPRALNYGEDLVDFRIFCPKVLAGIGMLPDTVADRAIPIRLERKLKDQPVKRFRTKAAEAEGRALGERILPWLESVGLTEGEPEWPEMPHGLSDREEEGVEPLLAIADAAGRGPEARAAVVKLLTEDRLDTAKSTRELLLSDLRKLFGDKRKMTTDEILIGLQTIEEAPWATYYGRGFTARDLAALLRPYGIESKAVRTGPGPNDVHKGYDRDDLYDAWGRYLSEDLVLKATESFCTSLSQPRPSRRKGKRPKAARGRGASHSVSSF